MGHHSSKNVPSKSSNSRPRSPASTQPPLQPSSSPNHVPKNPSSNRPWSCHNQPSQKLVKGARSGKTSGPTSPRSSRDDLSEPNKTVHVQFSRTRPDYMFTSV